MNNEGINYKKSKHYGFAMVFAITTFICVAISVNDPPQGIYIYMPMITFTFGILTIVFFSIFQNMTLVTIIVYGFMYLRYTVTLFILHIDGYPKGIYNILIDYDASLRTAFTMIFEMLMIFLALYISSRKYNKNISAWEYKKRVLSKDNFSSLNILLVLFVLVTIALFIIYPALFKNYSFIFNSNLEGMTDLIISSQVNLPSGFRWIGYTFGEATRYILVEYFILRLYKRYALFDEKKSRYWVLALLIAILNTMITNQRMMVGIFMSLVFFYQIYQLFPEKRKLFIFFAFVIGTSAFSVITIRYWSNALSYQSFSQMIQGYTNGFYNVYQASNAYNNASISFFDKIAMFFIGDGLGNVNVISMFINSMNSSNIYNHYIYGLAFNGGAVLPFVSQMSFYFSGILGPIFSFLIIMFAKKMENNSINSTSNILITQFCAFIFAATPFMYNYSANIHILTVVVLPIWLLAKFNSKNVVLGHVTRL